jgi:peptidyl-prolyl cis-trans isomerase B (cyclophilin B)
VRRALFIIVIALGLLGAGCGSSASDSAATSTEGATTGTSADGATTAASETATSADGCTDVAAPAPREDGGAKKPTERLDPEMSYELVFETNCGSFTVTLDVAKAPATAASLVSLARSGFYDRTVFHRIVPDFVIQGGDPTQSGSGGPGYQTVDAPPSDARYTKGVVAMAKTGAEPPGTSGSQFFVVTGADIGLPADYAIVGNVTSGIDVVERIGALGDPTTELPTRPVVIESVTVKAQ